MAENNIISKNARLDRAIDLKCKGLTDREISVRMTEEGYKYASERTINRILNEITEERIVEELKRQQLRDITTADSPIRLKYRDKLLEKMMPQKIEQKTEGSQNLKITVVDEVARNQMDPSPGTEKPPPK